MAHLLEWLSRPWRLEHLLDLCIALVSLTAGAAVGWWLCRRHVAGGAEAERARVAVQKLSELAADVAQGVGDHATRVRQINSDLQTAQAAGGDGLDDAVLGAVADLLEANEKLEQKLESAEVKLQQQAIELQTQAAVARTDPLTGTYNRRALDDELRRRFSEWQRRNVTFSLMMLDADHFKRFNDEHGHQAGDEVLKGIARALTQTMREMDIVARYGGEEFAVVLPSTPLGEACRAAERARVAIEAANFVFGGKQLKVTASLGVAQVDAIDDPARLIRRADEALYAAKQAGRNRVWLHDGEACQPAVSQPAEPRAAAPSAPAGWPQTEPSVSAPSIGACRDVSAVQQAFRDDLDRRVLECRNFDVPLSLMLLDLDGFAALADRIGPAQTQIVQTALAELLEAALHDMDAAAPCGTGRFLVMMPGTTRESAARAAEKLRKGIAQCPLKIGGQPLSLRPSAGVAQVQPGDDAQSLFVRAEAALRAAQQSGGQNHTFVHTGDGCIPADALAAAGAL